MNKFATLNLIGKSEVFLRSLRLIERFSTCDVTVLILGETGTGKELAARAIHYLSSRRDGPFVPVNCAALPDNLVESEIFGHVKGAFTDARETRSGLVTQANGGTLFLDEIEAMSLRAQGVLLRFLQDKEYRAVGGGNIKTANVRVIGACNANLSEMVRQGQFRADLLFRLNSLSLELPPLRSRAGDIMLLTEEFLTRLNHQSSLPHKNLHPDSKAILETHDWPGNVRELENLLRREYILEEGTVIKISDPACASFSFMSEIRADSIFNSHEITKADPRGLGGPERRRLDRRRDASRNHANGGRAIFQFSPKTGEGHLHFSYQNFKQTKDELIAQFEIEHLVALMTQAKGNLSLAARLSGRDRSDLCKLLKRHGLDRQQFCEDLANTNSLIGASKDLLVTSDPA